MQAAPLIQANGLAKHYPMRAGTLLRRQHMTLRAVDDVTLGINPGETLGLVGNPAAGSPRSGGC